MENIEVFEIPAEYKPLLEDEVFLAKIEKATNAETVVDLFAEKGISLSAEIAQEVFDMQRGELSEEKLEDVAGGGPVGAVVGGLIGGVGTSLVVYYTCRNCGYSISEASKKARKYGTYGALIGGAIGGVATGPI